MDPFCDISALVQVKSWFRTGDKPESLTLFWSTLQKKYMYDEFKDIKMFSECYPKFSEIWPHDTISECILSPTCLILRFRVFLIFVGEFILQNVLSSTPKRLPWLYPNTSSCKNDHGMDPFSTSLAFVPESTGHRSSQQDSNMMRSSNENISALLILCAGNSPVTDEFPSQKPVTRRFSLICSWTNAWDAIALIMTSLKLMRGYDNETAWRTRDGNVINICHDVYKTYKTSNDVNFQKIKSRNGKGETTLNK